MPRTRARGVEARRRELREGGTEHAREAAAGDRGGGQGAPGARRKREAGDESEVYDATQGVRGIPEAGGGRGGAGAGAGEESGEGALRQEGEEGTEVRAFFRTSRVGVGN